MQLFFASQKTWRQAAAVAGLMLASLAAATTVSAQQPAQAEPTFNQRYPAASIHSTEAADAALEAANKERAMLEDRYLDDQRACYKKFFVSSCLEAAKERNRASVKEVKEVEVVANAYKRQAKADERDKSLSEQRVKDEQDAARRAKDQQDKAAASARKVQESEAKQRSVAEREGKADGHADDRVKAHEAKLRSIQAEEAAKAPQRAANEQAYKDKVKAAEAHKKDVEARKADKERERAAKQVPATPVAPADPAPSR